MAGLPSAHLSIVGRKSLIGCDFVFENCASIQMFETPRLRSQYFHSGESLMMMSHPWMHRIITCIDASTTVQACGINTKYCTDIMESVCAGPFTDARIRVCRERCLLSPGSGPEARGTQGEESAKFLLS